jgi:hypothetical protein
MRIGRHVTPACALLVALLAGCGEEHHYAVDMQGNARRVDADGKPLPGEPEPAAAAATHAKGGLHAIVQLDPALGIDPAAFACVFVMAWRDATGAPSIVQKLERPTFPLELELAPDGTHGTELSGGYLITARLDADGDALAQPGDVQGSATQLVAAGSLPVTVVLNERISEESATAPAAVAPAAPVAPFAGGAAEQPPTAEDLAGPRFKGSVQLAPEFAALDGKHTLFVIVRPAGMQGMPIAVKKFAAAKFPLEFDLGTESVALDVDNKREILEGELKVYARLSLSGQPVGQPGDIEAEGVITSAGRPIALTLSKPRTP